MMIIKGPVHLEAQACITALRPVWVLSHPHPVYGGSMTHKVIDQLYRRAVQRGISVIRYNFRGVGKSGGSYDDAVGEVDDLRLVIDYLEESYAITAEQLHLIGYSFGSYISAMVASSMQSLHRLSLIAPPTSMFSFPGLQKNFPLDVYMPEKDEYTEP
ncbi:MAG: alpha/beta fold hydrolase, partial [Deltaproteobacteria bacterium]|nr:alpha/beta fold hydrolase [Deltaproteobacteria bacterium]